MQLPEKARHLRVIIAEMGRIASHLVGMGAYGLDLGTFSPFLYAFREREKILDLFEEVCGARLTYSYITPGGATADLPRGWLQKCEAFLDAVRADHQRISHAAHDATRSSSSARPTSASCRAEMAIDYGCTGPVLRGSGVDYDLRRDGEERYTEMYDGYAFEVIVEKNGHYPKDHDYPAVPTEAVLGDCWHRFYVRMLEVMQSIDLVRQAIERYSTATGDWGTPIKLSTKLPKGEAYLETEAPRGQMGFYIVSDGNADSLARPRPQQFASATSRHPRTLQGLPDRRRAGDRRLARHRDGRD